MVALYHKMWRAKEIGWRRWGGHERRERKKRIAEVFQHFALSYIPLSFLGNAQLIRHTRSAIASSQDLVLLPNGFIPRICVRRIQLVFHHLMRRCKYSAHHSSSDAWLNVGLTSEYSSPWTMQGGIEYVPRYSTQN